MSFTPNDNSTTMGGDHLDAWGVRFRADLQYYIKNGIERPQDIQGMSASNSGQEFPTFGGPVEGNYPDPGSLAPALGRLFDDTEGRSQGPYYQYTYVPESHVDNAFSTCRVYHPAHQQHLAPYAGEQVEFGNEAQESWQTGSSAPTVDHMLSVQQGPSAQHKGIAGAQDIGLGVAQMSTQNTNPVTVHGPAHRTAKGKNTKRIDDIRRRLVRPGPAGGLTLELFNPLTESWDPAIRHADIRDQLLQEADAEAARYGGYDFAPAEGENDADRTSFVRAHQSWGPERANRPEINFIFDRPLRALPAHVQPCSQPISWLWRGYIVLDHADDPMRHFDDCPTVLSSAIEGFRVDAILKRNPAIKTLDLWGRLPPQHTKRGSSGGVARTKELNTTQAVTNVAWRWRHKACILSWDRRAGWEHKKAFLREFLTPQQLAQNTTRGREDLNKDELKELEEYVQSAKAAARNKRRVPPPPRRNNVALPGPTSLSPNPDAGQSLPTAEHMQQGLGSSSNQNLGIPQHLEEEDHADCYPSPRGLKRKAKTLEEDEWKEAGREIDNIVDRRRQPSSPRSGEVSHVIKRPRYDSLSPEATSQITRYPNDTLFNSEVNQVRGAPGQGAAHGKFDIDTAPQRSVSTFLDPVDAVQNQDSEPDSYSSEEQYVVAAGNEPVVFPIGGTVTIFSPDGVTVQQSVIGAIHHTIWKQRAIAETIQVIQHAEAVKGVNGPTENNTSSGASHKDSSRAFDGTLQEISGNDHSEISSFRQKQSAPTKEWLFTVPQGTTAFQFPIGNTIICFTESDMDIRRATLGVGGETEWNEISRPEAISILESMQARTQIRSWPTEGSPERGVEHDDASITLPNIAGEDNHFGSSDVNVKAGEYDAPSTAPIVADPPPGTVDPRHIMIRPETEQYGLEGEVGQARPPRSRATLQTLCPVGVANITYGDDILLPPIENYQSAARPHIAPSLRALILQGELRSRDALKIHAYTKRLLGEDEMLILVANKIDVPTGIPGQFGWCEDSKRWVPRPPSRQDAPPVRDVSPEKDDVKWEYFISSRYLDGNGEPNGIMRLP